MGKPSMHPGVLALCVALAAALGVMAYRSWFMDHGPPPIKPQNLEQRASTAKLTAEPFQKDMGKHSPCDEPLTFNVKLTNNTKETIKITRSGVTCACTSYTIEGDRTLKPGESRDMEVRVVLTGVGKKSQRVDLLDDTSQLAQVRVDYEIEAPVLPEVDAVDVGPSNLHAQVKIKRLDGKPLKVLKVTPDLGGIITLTDGTQAVQIDADKADAYMASEASKSDGSVRRNDDGTWMLLHVSVETDYPGCPNTSVLVRRAR